MQFLLFRLYGTIASWGDLTVGEIRPTSLYPSKSAIIGLLSAALGYARDSHQKEITELSESIGIAVRMDSPASIMRDFHTFQKAETGNGKNLTTFYTRRDELLHTKIGTGLSTRDYVCDGLYTICLWIKNDTSISLQQIGLALRKPEFHLYLGRKSCPISYPIVPSIIDSDSIYEAFLHEDSIATQEEQQFRSNLFNPLFPKYSTVFEPRYFWEECNFHGFTEVKLIERFTRRDDPRSRTRWQFGERFEYHTIVPVTKALQEETQ